MKQDYVGNICFILGDSLEVLPTLPKESFDLLLTDPPYYVLRNDPHKENRSWDIDPWKTLEDYLEWSKGWLSMTLSLLKPGASGYIFWGQKHMRYAWDLFESVGFQVNRMLVWHHPNLAKTTNKMYLWTYDPVFYVSKGTPSHFYSSFTEKKNVDVFKFAKPQNWGKKRKRHHPAEKPLDLCKILIENSTKDATAVVLDPFTGSGTSNLAAALLGRKSVGIEKSPEFYEVALSRCREYLTQEGV